MLEQNQIKQIETMDTATKHPARLRNKEFLIRFTQEEFDELDYFIKKSGKTRAEFILDFIRSDKIILIDNLSKVWAELHQQGNNINQIAKAMNTYCILLKKQQGPEYDFDEYIKDFTKELNLAKEKYNQLTLCVKEILERMV